MSHDINKLIQNVTAKLNEKQKKVITKRYGLSGAGKLFTLQAIGDELGVTRERVRQIENQAMTKIKNAARTHARELVDVASEHLAHIGNAQEDKVFIEAIEERTGTQEKKRVEKNKLRFIFRAAEKPLHFKETPVTRCFWYTNEATKRAVLTCIKETKARFESGDKKRIIEDKELIKEIEDTPEYHFLLISKHFGINPFGDLGLAEWPEITPKNIRDKAYLTIKKHSKPMHFEEIAEWIWKYGISKKRVNVQTVHNELIKDDRFVLVGRGIYGLREHGYEPGTVREVIGNLIKKHGPLTSERVIQLTNKVRVLKENTILLNLQSRKHFTRLKNGTYDVREA